MRIAWLTPVPPARSGIAETLWTILPILRKHAEVTLWAPQEETDSRLADLARVRRLPPTDGTLWAELNRSDIVLYSLGNHAGFHAPIWDVCRHHPGIVILHDPCLQHLFHDLYCGPWQRPESYVALMAREYGSLAGEAARAVVRGEYEPLAIAAQYPLTHYAVRGSLGTLVHNAETLKTLESWSPVPIQYSGLPHRPRHSPTDHTPLDPGFRLILFGHLGRNRRIESILRAIAGLRGRIPGLRLDVCGEMDDRASVESLRTRCGLDDEVHLHGFVEEEELHRRLSESDVAINLRHPTMGEASLSQLLIWEHGLPSLVTRSGWYAGLPRGAVTFVRVEREIEDLQEGILALARDPERRRSMGHAGRTELDRSHQPEDYVDRLLTLIDRALASRSTTQLFSVTESLGARLSFLTGSPARTVIAERLAVALRSLGRPQSRYPSARRSSTVSSPRVTALPDAAPPEASTEN